MPPFPQGHRHALGREAAALVAFSSHDDSRRPSGRVGRRRRDPLPRPPRRGTRAAAPRCRAPALQVGGQRGDPGPRDAVLAEREAVTRPDWLALSRADLVADPLERAILAEMRVIRQFCGDGVTDRENIGCALRLRAVIFTEDALIDAL